MNNSPETRYSLLLRICDPTDGMAWQEFWELYEPVVYRIARRFGLQDADARDLTQDVLAAINKSICDWNPDPRRGRFRAWLHVIVRNKMISAIRRRRPGDRGTGDTDMIRRLEAHSTPADDAFEYEFRRSAFHQAADRVKQEVDPNIWEAFWRTSVMGKPIREVALELDLSIGSVYAARSRVLARLRRVIEAKVPTDS